MPRKPQPVEVRFALAKPIYEYVVWRAERDFETVDRTLHRIVLEAMQNDPAKRAEAQAAEAAQAKAKVELAKAAAAQAKADAAQAKAAKEAIKEAARVERATLIAETIAEKLAKKAERHSPNVEISDEEVYEARQLIHKFPPTLVHGKAATGLKGVEQYNTKFRAAFTLMGVRRHLGIFDKAADAGRAYDAMCRRVYGKKALLNFPNDGELSAKDGRQLVVKNGVATWRTAPTIPSYPQPRPVVGLPTLSVPLVRDEKGNLYEPPGARAEREALRHKMILEQLERDAAEGGAAWDDSVTDPIALAAEEERLRKAAMDDLPADWHEPPPVVHAEPAPFEEPAHEPVPVEEGHGHDVAEHD